MAAMGSQFKKAHRTHALAQPAGEPYPHPAPGAAEPAAAADTRSIVLFRELCARLPDADARAQLLGVERELEAAWRRGSALPVLRARRKAVERALKSLP
jgi:hypothetical protein